MFKEFPLKFPKFWHTDNILTCVLIPFSWLYYVTARIHRKITSRKQIMLPVPVICVGNITVGGVGKTPIVIALGKLLQKEKKDIAFISKGYRGKERGPLWIDKAKHTAEEVGDEALLLAHYAPCTMGKNRIEACIKALQDKKIEYFILDDGMQDSSLHKTKTIMVVDNEVGLYNQRLLPAGPLREPWEEALKKTDALVIIKKTQHAIVKPLPPFSIPVFYAYMVLVPPQEAASYIAFAGIGRPIKFFDSLKASGYFIIDHYSFPDHHLYTEKECSFLLRKAEEHHVQLITTRKDYVRLSSFMQKKVMAPDVCVVWEDEKKITEFMQKM